MQGVRTLHLLSLYDNIRKLKQGRNFMSQQISTSNLRKTVHCALFTALIIIGAYISIPIPVGPVPIALADFFVMLTGLFMGAKYGMLIVILYLALGILGMPVFSSGGAGLAFILGPTGGFLMGYLPLVTVIGFSTPKQSYSLIRTLIGIVIGNIFLYALGIIWLRMSLDLSWGLSIASGLTPFLPGTIIKIIVALGISRTLVPAFKEKMNK